MQGRFAIVRAALFTGWAVLGSACSQGASSAEFVDGPPARNLVLVSVDTLRADRLGVYGASPSNTPHLDGLAEGGTLFENAFSTASWTVPAHASMLTGLYPRSHGVDSVGEALSADTIGLAGLLGAAGFQTTALVNMHFLAQESGIATGFDVHAMISPAATAEGATAKIVRSAKTWMESNRNERFFLFLHTYDVHSPYRAPEAFYDASEFAGYAGPADGRPETLQGYNTRDVDSSAEWGARDAVHLGRLYDGGVRALDASLAELFRFLEESGLAQETLVAVTSDHGEAFLEHGFVSHGWTLFDEELRVPLILAGPRVPEGIRLAQPASLVDLVPTLTGLLGLDVPASLDGVDLSQAWLGGELDPARPIFAEAGGGPVGEPVQRTLQAGTLKLHMDPDGALRLFDLAADPGETRDLVESRPELSRTLGIELERFGERAEGQPGTTSVDPELRAELEKLGYF